MSDVVAYTALHYGSPYLRWAILSVIEHVDRYVVLYSPHGSHGSTTDTPIPVSESRPRLLQEAHTVAGSKLEWIDGDWHYEGQQRDTIYDMTDPDDLVVTLDYDEIWYNTGALIQHASATTHRHYYVPMVHFWRSFHQAVTNDASLPVRIERRVAEGSHTFSRNTGHINHMGYAIPDELMHYKWQIHGHKAEMRSDLDWYNDIWKRNARADCHPTNIDHWYPQTVKAGDMLPGFMRQHPYWTRVII